MTTCKRFAYVFFLIPLFLEPIFSQSNWQSNVVYYDTKGKLAYLKDSLNNRIPNFSYAGYKNGKAPLPYVPVIKTIYPETGNNTLQIQNAINEIGVMPLNQEGFRGALYLAPGVYRVSGSIRINYDGVVLRGAGNGDDTTLNTIIYGTGDTPHQRYIIVAGGGNDSGWKEQVQGTVTNITSDTVFEGSQSFTVDNPSLFQQGDNIIIYHPATSAWIAAVGGGGTAEAPAWTVSEGINIDYNRYIKNISGDTITIDAPIFNTLVRSLSQSYMYKYARTELKTEIGIENLRVDIVTAGVTTDQNGNENHAWQAIDMFQVEDSWVKNCTMLHFGQSGIRLATATRVTIDSCNALDPISIITGERRYNFNMYHSAQLNLVEHCFSRYARHDFISNGTSTTSGDVFYKDQSESAYASSEGHRWWTQGLLYDNVNFTLPNTTILLGLYCRGSYGTSQGWGAVNSVAWNCSVPAGSKIIIQQPPTALNYAVGCFAGLVTGLQSQGAPFNFPQGYIEGTNKAGLVPSSLYEAQLTERISNVQVPQTPDDLLALPVSSRRIDLTWHDNSSNEIGFRIEHSTDNGSTWNVINIVGINFTSYSDTGLAPLTKYYYRVKAEINTGSSDYSNVTQASTAAALPIVAPDSLSATVVSLNEINLTWKDNSNNEDGFVIERSAGNDTAWIILSTEGINAVRYSDTGLKDSTKYFYLFRAENIYGYSNYSNTVFAVTSYYGKGDNLALNKSVTCSSEQMEGGSGNNHCTNAVDGDVNTRWSSARNSVWPQWILVDLGSELTINKTKLVFYNDRAYQYTIDVKQDSSSAYTRVVDRTNNQTPGTVDTPIVDVFDSIKARFVKLIITGAYGYAGPWTSIDEFRIFNSSIITGLRANKEILPENFILFQNYPNPFNPSTVISYRLSVKNNVTLIIYNVLGREINTLINGLQNAGLHSCEWSGQDFNNRHVASGVYLAQLKAGTFIKTIKLLLIK